MTKIARVFLSVEVSEQSITLGLAHWAYRSTAVLTWREAQQLRDELTKVLDHAAMVAKPNRQDHEDGYDDIA